MKCRTSSKLTAKCWPSAASISTGLVGVAGVMAALPAVSNWGAVWAARVVVRVDAALWPLRGNAMGCTSGICMYFCCLLDRAEAEAPLGGRGVEPGDILGGKLHP